MGFTVSDVLSDESHYSEFLCPVCRDLADDAYMLPCSHVFCRFCLSQWVGRAAKRGESPEAPTCPSCRTQSSLSASEMRPLFEANPLAARILGRVRVRCPLSAQGCQWLGDYSEVQAHLTNSEEHLGTRRRTEDETMTEAPRPAGAASRRENAEALKAQADGKYAARAYEQAAALYSKAIALAPEVATFWANRAACSFMQRRYLECIDDCERALALDAALSKAARRKARAQVELSKFDCAAAGLSVAVAAAPSEREKRALVDEASAIKAIDDETVLGLRALRRGEFKAAVASLSKALKLTSAVVVVLGAALAEVGNGRLDRALRLTSVVLARHDAAAFRALACAVRGASLVLQDDGDGVETGLGLLREALRFDPDDDDAKATLRAAKRCHRDRQTAKTLMLNRDFAAAAAAYGAILDDMDAASAGPRASSDDLSLSDGSAALRRLVPPFGLLARASPLVAQIRAERANCALRLGDHASCLRDCARALYVVDDCIDAHLTRAAALRALGRYDDALADLTALIDRWGHHDVRVRHAYETTEFEARKAKRPDYYSVLGCRRVSTDKEIKAAYYRRSKEHHPDRHVNDDPEAKAAHEQAFKLVSEALEILDDPNKRKLYDEGYDKAAIDDRIAAAERAAREHGYHRPRA